MNPNLPGSRGPENPSPMIPPETSVPANTFETSPNLPPEEPVVEVGGNKEIPLPNPNEVSVTSGSIAPATPVENMDQPVSDKLSPEEIAKASKLCDGEPKNLQEFATLLNELYP